MITAVVLVFLLYVIVGLIVFWRGTGTPSPGSRSLVRTAANRLAHTGQGVGVTLHLSTKDIRPFPSKEPRSFDVLLIIDHSASMGNGPGSPLQEARDSVRDFVERLPQNTCRAGVIQFDTEAETLSDFVSDKASIQKAILKIESGGGTAIETALETALSLYRKAQSERESESSVQDLLILLSDGQSDPQSAREASDVLKQVDIRIVTIALGANADVNLMREIASTSEDCFTTLDPRELTALYQEVADSLEEVSAHQVVVGEKYNHVDVYLSDMGNTNPIRISLADGEIEWFLPFLSRGITEITYQIVPEQLGWHRIDLAPAEMVMQDAQGNSHKFKSNSGPYILVLPRFGHHVLFLFLNPVFWILFGRFLKEKPQVFVPVPEPVRYELPPEPELIIPRSSQDVRPSINPTFIAGIGYSGRWVLTHLKKTLLDTFGGSMPEHVNLLHIDVAIPEHLRDVKFAEIDLEADESVSISANLASMLGEVKTSPDAYPHLDWLPAKDLLQSFTNLNLVNSANGDRFLGRAALFENFERLSGVIQEKIKDCNRQDLDVLVVGSMSGGTGSGVLLDVCAMIRHALDKNKVSGAGINMLLLSSESFSAGGMASKSAQNATAFLRELDRIMVHREMPVTISYGPLDRPPVLITVSHIVDRIFITGSASSEALQTLYPMAAQFLLTWMQCNIFRNYFQNFSVIEAECTRQAVGAISHEFGLMSAQLPSRDIEDVLINRSMLHLLGDRFLHLTEQNDCFALICDKSVETSAKDALSALFDGQHISRPRPPYLLNMPGLSDNTTFFETAKKLDFLTKRSEFFQDQLIKQDLEQLVSLLDEWCSAVLNGRVFSGAPTAEIIAARRGRLAVLTRALDKFMEQCQQICQYAENSSIPERSGKAVEHFSLSGLTKIYQSYKWLAETVREQVLRWTWILVDGPPPDRSFVTAFQPDMSGLYRSINDKYQKGLERLRDMENISSVQYVVDKNVLDKIYNKCFEPFRDDLIVRFLWKVESDPSQLKVSIRLRLVTDREHVFEPGSDNIATIYEQLRDLISDEARPLTDLTLEEFKPDLPNFLLNNCRLPVSGSSQTTAAHVEKRLHSCLWAPNGSTLDDIKRRTHEVVLDLDCKDRFKATLISTEALQVLEETSVMAPVLRTPAPSWELPYVFPEEQTAARLEQFMSREKISHERIPASLIPYLRERESLQAFLLCLFHGRIVKQTYNIKECLALNWKDASYWLTTEENNVSSVSLLWLAMDQFILRKCDAYQSDRPLPISLLIQESPDILKSSGADLDMEEVRVVLHGLGLETHDGVIEQLLAIYKALVVARGGKIDEF